MDLCRAAGVEDRLRVAHFRLSYATTVPFQVGMAGSSAIVSATFKALMRFYRVTAADLKVPKPRLPAHILAAEREELGIAAGLQDRVVQVYQGLGPAPRLGWDPAAHRRHPLPCAVYMDFDESLFRAHGHGRYEMLDAAMLPTTYVAWARQPAGESGAHPYPSPPFPARSRPTPPSPPSSLSARCWPQARHTATCARAGRRATRRRGKRCGGLPPSRRKAGCAVTGGIRPSGQCPLPARGPHARAAGGSGAR